MKIQITFTITIILIIILSSCNQSINKIIIKTKPGEAIIQNDNGKYSDPMTTWEGFNQLKNNEKLYLSPGRVELTEPVEINNLTNVQIIGNNTSLVAKIDMPIITFTKTDTVQIYDLMVVHEIGGWCAQNCIEFYDASDIEIKKCKFDGSGYFGLALTKTSNAVIESNQFINCEYGLAAWSCTNLAVRNNSFKENRNLDIMVNNPAQFINDFNAENIFE